MFCKTIFYLVVRLNGRGALACANFLGRLLELCDSDELIAFELKSHRGTDELGYLLIAIDVEAKFSIRAILVTGVGGTDMKNVCQRTLMRRGCDDEGGRIERVEFLVDEKDVRKFYLGANAGEGVVEDGGCFLRAIHYLGVEVMGRKDFVGQPVEERRRQFFSRGRGRLLH